MVFSQRDHKKAKGFDIVEPFCFFIFSWDEKFIPPKAGNPSGITEKQKSPDDFVGTLLLFAFRLGRACLRFGR